jgi:hypothetical protein
VANTNVLNDADISDSREPRVRGVQPLMFDVLHFEPRSPSRLDEIRVQCCPSEKNNGEEIEAGWQVRCHSRGDVQAEKVPLDRCRRQAEQVAFSYTFYRGGKRTCAVAVGRGGRDDGA